MNAQAHHTSAGPGRRDPLSGETPPGGHSPDPDVVLQRYIEALLAGDRDSATDIVLRAAEQGMPPGRIYLEVLQPALYELGRLWEDNRISVAEEHYCTAVTLLTMSQLYPRIFSSFRVGRRFMGACVDGDQHEIGIRMVCDFFEMEGWDTYYIGASVPTSDLLRGLEQYRPTVLGLSVSMTSNFATAREMIQAVRARLGEQAPRILVGGHAFEQSPDLWRELGADGAARDPIGAVELCRADSGPACIASPSHGQR